MRAQLMRLISNILRIFGKDTHATDCTIPSGVRAPFPLKSEAALDGTGCVSVPLMIPHLTQQTAGCFSSDFPAFLPEGDVYHAVCVQVLPVTNSDPFTRLLQNELRILAY
jgi:hypothetical protein